MFAIIGAVIGFFQAMAPEFLKFQQDKRDKAHELDVMKLQMQMQQQSTDSHFQEIQLQGQQVEAVEIQKSYQSELEYSGKLSASVRPNVTYMAMGIYILQKALLVWAIIFYSNLPWLDNNARLVQSAAVIWTAFDETMLSWIIGFWFGSRQIKNAKS